MSKNDVEVFEVSQDDFDAICQKRLDKVGLTALELQQKHEDGRTTVEEFKIWMLVSSSRLLD